MRESLLFTHLTFLTSLLWAFVVANEIIKAGLYQSSTECIVAL